MLNRLLRWLTSRYYALCRALALARLKRLPTKPGGDADLKAIRRVLIVSVGLIGDTIMCLPVFGQARASFPNARITALVTTRLQALLAPAALCDAWLAFDASPFPLRGDKRRAWASLVKRVRDEHFDVGILLLADDFAPLLVEAGIPIRVGISGDEFSPYMTHTYSVGHARTWGPEERLNALRCLGLKPDSRMPQLAVSETARLRVSEKLRLVLEDHEKLILLHPFGRERHQHWPLNLALAFAEKASNRFGCRVAILGSDNERALWQASAFKFGQLYPVIDLIGALGLDDVSAAMERASVVVSTDSGPMHLAAALGRPVVGLFRARRPEHAKRYATLISRFGQSHGCEQLCAWDRCRSLPCRQMAALSIEEALSGVEEALRPQLAMVKPS